MNKLSFSWQNQMEKNGNENRKISTVLVCLFWLPCNNMCKTVKIKLSSLVLLGLWLVQTCLKRAKHFLKWFYLFKTAQKWKGRHPTGNCRVSFFTAKQISCMRNLQQGKYVHIICDIYQNYVLMNEKCEKKMQNNNTAPLGFYIGMLQLLSKQVQIFWNKSWQIK